MPLNKEIKPYRWEYMYVCVHALVYIAHVVIDWLILTVRQPVKGYFMPWAYGIAFIVRLYLDSCVIVS